MGRVKVCRVCKEVLYCQACGERQTPETPDWQQVLLRMRPSDKKSLEAMAKESGVSVAEYIRRKLLKES